jgi:hypothetical protein
MNMLLFSSDIGMNLETLAKIIRQAPSGRALVLRKSDDNDRLRIESDEERINNRLSVKL